MTLHLRLWKDGDPANATDHPFEQEVVKIGRDPASALQLARPNVSKTHACIEQREDGLILTDLKSRNGTYVNGVRIAPEDPHPLVPGDKVRVCDFIIEVVAWDRPGSAAALPPEETEQRLEAAAEESVRLKEEVEDLEQKLVVASEGERLAEENARRLAAAEEESGRLRGAIAALEEKAQRLAAAEAECGRLKTGMASLEEKARRLAAAEEECERLKTGMAVLEEKARHLTAAEEECERLKTGMAALEEKARRLAASEEECESLNQKVAALQKTAERLEAAAAESQRLKTELAVLQAGLAAVSVAPPQVQQVDESTALSRLKAVLETVLQPVLKIMKGRILFRSEFTGATMFEDPEMEAVNKQGPQEWIQYFMDAGLSEEKARDRLELLILETREIIPHVIGLLDGYRKSVDVGTKTMLQQLSPLRLREEISRKPIRVGPFSIPHRFLPLIADRIAWKAIVQRHRELQEEDRGILEQRFFRPGFIQGYISCISSAKHEPLPSRTKTSTSTKAKP
jgi:predicted component of type VI protein secretion system